MRYNEEIETKYNLKLLENIEISKVKTKFSALNSDGYVVNTTLATLRKGRTPNWILKNPHAIDNIKKYMEKEGCILLSDKYTPDVKLKYIANCGHEHEIILHHFTEGHGRICPLCARKNNKEIISLKFEKIEKELENENCKLINMYHENNRVFIEYIASCGHFRKDAIEAFRARDEKYCYNCYVEYSASKIYTKKLKEYKEILDSDGYEFIGLVEKGNRKEIMYYDKCGHVSINSLSEYKRRLNRGIKVCKDCYRPYGYYNPHTAKINKDNWLKVDCLIYLIKLSNDSESFYKIGITTRDIKKRMYEINGESSYEIEIIGTINNNLYNCIL